MLGTDGESARIDIGGKTFIVPRAGRVRPNSGSALLVVRPEALRLISLANVENEIPLKGCVDRFTYFGNIARYEVATENGPLLIESYNPEAFSIFEEGDNVGVLIDFESVRLLPPEDKEQQ